MLKLKEIKKEDLLSIKKGDKFYFQGKETIHHGATYAAEVVQVCKRHVTLSLSAVQSTLMTPGFGPSKPYNFSVNYVDLFKTDHLYYKES